MIAEGTGNKHYAVRQLIDKYISDFEEFGKVTFEMYPLKSGQSIKIYLLNEEQSTLLLTYMRNSDKIRAFKKRLVAEFYQMRKILQEKQTVEWLETRKQGQFVRKETADTIKQLCEYAKAQGSTHSAWFYSNYTQLANKAVGITDRNLATIVQLNRLELVEGIILNQIREGMKQELHYKEIYALCKQQVELFSNVALLDKAV
jgi:phage regulator Rha-like protein